MFLVNKAKSYSSEQALRSPLRTSPISDKIKSQIAVALWNVDYDEPRFTAARRLESYFRYYTEQSDQFLHDLGRYVSVRSHQDVIEIVKLLKSNVHRNEILSRFNVNSDHLNSSIDLAVRLLVMMEVGRIPNSFLGRKEIEWKGDCLKDFMTKQFPKQGKLGRENVKLEKLFIAINLERVAGIRIYWTNNLADHLRLMEHDSEVAIFHHSSYLQYVQSSDLFPPGLTEETVRSLALLFPQSDTETRKWFKKLRSIKELDPAAIECGQLRAEDRHIDDFAYWRDRIVILKQVFDESKPRSWSQWWYDRRNGYERFPIVLAAAALVLTALFGFIQCLEGALQTYRAFHPPPT